MANWWDSDAPAGFVGPTQQQASGPSDDWWKQDKPAEGPPSPAVPQVAEPLPTPAAAAAPAPKAPEAAPLDQKGVLQRISELANLALNPVTQLANWWTQDLSPADAAKKDTLGPPAPFEYAANALRGAGTGIMRSGVKAGDLLATLGSLVGGAEVSPDTSEAADELQNQLRKQSLEYWQVSPERHNRLGDVLGGLGEAAIPLMLTAGNPLGLVASETLATGKDFIDLGVDATTAGKLAALRGATTYGGMNVPFLGESLASKMGWGSSLFAALDATERMKARDILENAGYPELAKLQNPLDPQSLITDALMGALFGGVAHMRSSPAEFNSFRLDPERLALPKPPDATTPEGFPVEPPQPGTPGALILDARSRRDARVLARMQDIERVTGETPSQPSTGITRFGEFSPLLPGYREGLQRLADITDQVNALTEEYKKNQTLTLPELQEQLQQNRSPSESEYQAGIDLDRGKVSEGVFNQDLAQTKVNTDIEKALPRGITVEQAIQKQPVVVAGFTQYKEKMDWMDRMIQGLRDTLDLYQKKPPEELIDRHTTEGVEKVPISKTIEDLKRSIMTAEATRKSYLEQHQTALAFAKEAKGLLATLRNRFLDPDTKLILSDDAFTQRTSGSDAYGSMWSSAEGKKIHLGVSVDTIMNDPRVADKLVKMRETLLHEFGHGLLNQRLVELSKRVDAVIRSPKEVSAKVNSGSAKQSSYWVDVANMQAKAAEAKAAGQPLKPYATPQEIALLKGIMQEYLTWAGNRLAEPFFQRFATISPPNTIDIQNRQVGKGVLPSQVPNMGYWYSFDEYIAENLSRAATQHKYITQGVRKFFESHRKLLEQTYKEYANLSTMPTFERWLQRMSITGKMAELAAKQAKKALNWYDLASNKKLIKELGLEGHDFSFRESLDNYQRWYNLGLDITQLSRKNPHIEPLSRYVKWLVEMKQRVGQTMWRGHNTLRAWRKLGASQGKLVADALVDQTLEERVLTDAELKARGFRDESLAVMKQVQADYKQILDRMGKVLETQVRETFGNDPVFLQQELTRLHTELAKMAEKPFSPLMRFGKYTVQVKASEAFEENGVKYKKGQVLYFETFDRQKPRDRHMAQVRSDWAGKPVAIGKGFLTDSFKTLQGMPTMLLTGLRRQLQKHGILTPQVDAALKEISEENLPIDSIKRHWSKRKKIPGFSTDYMRSYSSYIAGMANHLGRIELGNELYRAVGDIEKDAKIIQSLGGDGTKRGQIAQMAKEHLDRFFNPGNDWPFLRAVMFANVFWFNVKSAFVNGLQPLMATYPYLAARYGDVEATKAMTKAVGKLARYFATGKIHPELADMIARGQETSILEQSLATEIAMARSAKSQWDIFPSNFGKRVLTKFNEIGAWPFATVEKVNRYLSAIAQHDLSRRIDGLPPAQATAMALDTAANTQGNYERWARAKLLTGPIGANIFLYKTYMQKMLFLALGNNPESNRVLFMMLLMGGLAGLPFAEDLLDLLDAAGTSLKRHLGWSNPKVQSRQALREMLLDMDVNPDLFLHGLAENSMGLGFLGDLMGWPVPQLDVQGSISMGNIVPGTSALARIQEGDLQGAALDALAELGGPEASYTANVMKSLLSDNPDTWSKWEISLPAFFRALSKSGRYATQGGEFDAAGHPIAEFDPNDTQDTMELASQAFGFTPSKVTRGWEQYLAEKEVVTYYASWRQSLLAHNNAAHLSGDSEQVDLQMRHITEYNDAVPFPEMKLTGPVLQESLLQFYKDRALAGRDIPRQRSYRRLEDSVKQLYQQ